MVVARAQSGQNKPNKRNTFFFFVSWLKEWAEWFVNFLTRRVVERATPTRKLFLVCISFIFSSLWLFLGLDRGSSCTDQELCSRHSTVGRARRVGGLSIINTSDGIDGCFRIQIRKIRKRKGHNVYILVPSKVVSMETSLNRRWISRHSNRVYISSRSSGLSFLIYDTIDVVVDAKR